MPIVGSLWGYVVALLVGLSTGGTFLLMVLSASASYIAVPAAMRLPCPMQNQEYTYHFHWELPFRLT
jgi:hypothetical protein